MRRMRRACAISRGERTRRAAVSNMAQLPQIDCRRSQFASEIRVEKDGEEVDGKSIMGLMMLAAGHGSILTLTTEGTDAEEALNALADLVQRNFEEN